jgi:hypothetical protein
MVPERVYADDAGVTRSPLKSDPIFDVKSDSISYPADAAFRISPRFF